MRDPSKIRRSTSIHGMTRALEIMVNTICTSSWVIRCWIAAAAIVTFAVVVMGANLSTTARLVALGIAPGLVIAVLADRAPSPTVVPILHSVETKGGRS